MRVEFVGGPQDGREEPFVGMPPTEWYDSNNGAVYDFERRKSDLKACYIFRRTGDPFPPKGKSK